MLKGNISSDLDTHTEEESSYVTLSNGPFGKKKKKKLHIYLNINLLWMKIY